MTTQIVKDQIADEQIGDNHIDAGNKPTEANLSLNYPTHDNANDPTTDEKNALDDAPNALSSSNPVADKSYVDSVASGASWQEPVEDKDVTDPSTLSPSTGERWIVATSAIGVWSGHDGEIATWNGTGWDFDSPENGWALFVDDENIAYVQTADSAAWVWTQMTGVSDVTPGSGLTRNGQELNVGAGSGIVVNADDVAADWETADPQAVGTAAAGSSEKISRSDHVHPHGDQGGGSEHAVASGGSAGFQSTTHYTKVENLPAARYVQEFSGGGSAGPFTLSNTPKGDDYVTVFKNGVRQKRGGSDDYTRSGNQITFTSAVGSGQSVSVEYWT